MLVREFLLELSRNSLAVDLWQISVVENDRRVSYNFLDHSSGIYTELLE